MIKAKRRLTQAPRTAKVQRTPRYVGSKWKKTLALLRNDSVKRFVPKTVRLTKPQLAAMLDEFGMVYVKPIHGTYGLGVMRVEKRMPEPGGVPIYRYQSGTEPKDFPSFDRLYATVLKGTRGKSYLVQKGIQLLKYNGRRFDVRIMVQQNLQKQWETTGLIGRVAAPKKIVTNYHNGGRPMDMETLLAPLTSPTERAARLAEMRSMGVEVAKTMHRAFPGIREIGIDVGLDGQFKPWILEVNTCPDPFIFRKLKDKRIVRKIIRYCRAYGRLK